MSGRARPRPFIETSDIVANNFRPGVMDRLGFGYEKLEETNPRIIWAAATGYGLTGHRSGRSCQ